MGAWAPPSLGPSVMAGSARMRIPTVAYCTVRTLLELRLCAPATFGPLDSSAFAWVANGGGVHRIDYVAVPGGWGCDARQCDRFEVVPRRATPHEPGCSVHVVDAAGDWEDHFLVALIAPWW